MVKLRLPFESMARSVRVDVITFEPTYDHPILDICSSYAYLKKEVASWLYDTLEEDSWDFKFDTDDYYLFFSSKDDYLMFTLRWL